MAKAWLNTKTAARRSGMTIAGLTGARHEGTKARNEKSGTDTSGRRWRVKSGMTRRVEYDPTTLVHKNRKVQARREGALRMNEGPSVDLVNTVVDAACKVAVERDDPSLVTELIPKWIADIQE